MISHAKAGLDDPNEWHDGMKLLLRKVDPKGLDGEAFDARDCQTSLRRRTVACLRVHKLARCSANEIRPSRGEDHVLLVPAPPQAELMAQPTVQLAIQLLAALTHSREAENRQLVDP